MESDLLEKVVALFEEAVRREGVLVYGLLALDEQLHELLKRYEEYQK